MTMKQSKHTFLVTCGDLDAGEDGPDFDDRFIEVFRLRGNLQRRSEKRISTIGRCGMEWAWIMEMGVSVCKWSRKSFSEHVKSKWA